MTRYTLEEVRATEDAKGPKYVAKYLCRTNDPLDFNNTIIRAMPWRLGDKFRIGNDYDPRAVVLSVVCDPVPKNNFAYQYSVEFGLREREEPDNPLLEPPEVELDFAQFMRPFDRDMQGRSVANTIGDRFDDVLEKEDSQPVLRITRNEPIGFAMRYMDLRDCINRSVWQGAPARTIKMQPPRLAIKRHGVIGKYAVKSYEFKFSDNTWQFILLNQGYYRLAPAADPPGPSTRVRIKIDGEDAITPLPLTQAGAIVSASGSPHWITFDGYRESILPSFGSLL